jgi:hypothetical protein
MGSNTNPRQQLRDAIEASAEALSAMHSAENLLARANEMLGALRAKRADFDSLDSQIATARVDLIRQALDSEDNVHLLTEEPGGFAVAKSSRDNLDTQIAGVSDSIAVLQEQLTESRKAAEMADYLLDQARAAVFAAEAEKLAIEFLARLEELRHVSMRLSYMSMRTVKRNPATIQRHNGPYYGGGATSTITMPKVVVEAVGEECMGSYFRKNTPRKKDEISAAVSSWWAALRTDAEAHLDEATKEGMFRPSVGDDASADASLTQAAE